MVTELGKNWDEVLKRERIAVVKCYGTWCGPCKFYSPHFQRFSENIGVYNEVPIKYYQSDNDKLPDLKQMYRVDRLPSTIFLIHGILVATIHGVTRQAIVERTLQQVLQIPYHIKKG